MRLTLLALLVLATAACGGVPAPAPLERGAACASCRMAVSDRKSAAQIAAPYEEPLFFDDIGCLRGYLERGSPTGDRAVAYVADHRTGAWIPAATAIYSRCEAVPTPMSSHILAHADAASRDADPDACKTQMAASEILRGALAGGAS